MSITAWVVIYLFGALVTGIVAYCKVSKNVEIPVSSYLAFSIFWPVFLTAVIILRILE